MSPIVPDAEALVIAWGNTRADLPDFYAEVPRDRPDEFITVERTGGARERHRDLPDIAIQAWSTRPAEASALAGRVTSAIEHGEQPLRYIERIARVEVNTVARFPGPGGEPRYQILLELVTD